MEGSLPVREWNCCYFLLVSRGEYVPSSLILKNMPDVVYQRLKVAV